MPDTVVKVNAGKPITVKMSFDGIANHYEAHIYAPLPGQNQWKRIQTLESDGSSEDARPDEFTFDPPSAGNICLLFFQSAMTAVAVPADVKVTATIHQAGEAIGESSVSGNVQSFANVVLRVQLEAP